MFEKLFKKGKRENEIKKDTLAQSYIESATNDEYQDRASIETPVALKKVKFISDEDDILKDVRVTEEEYKATMNKVDELLFKPARENFMKNTIPNMPLAFRLNFVLNTTTTRPLAGVFTEEDDNEPSEPYPDDKINWDEINKILFGIPHIYGDYNYELPKEVHSRKELIKLRMMINCAEIIGAWREEKCKDCGKKFYLTKGETQYYLDRELKLPKRCKECRDRRKQNNNKINPTHTPGLI